MKKILFIVSFFALFIFPLQTNAAGTVTVGPNCNAYFDWSSSNSTTCRINGVPVGTSGTNGPYQQASGSRSATAECENSSGQLVNDTATIIWSSSLPSCGGGGGPRYSCSGTSCIPDSNGPYTSSNCDNSCSAPPINYYRCSGSSCIQDNVSGTFTQSNCGGVCTAPRYGCDPANPTMCVQIANGPYASSNCSGACGTQRWSCASGSCIFNQNGPFTESTCNGYSCSQTPQCTMTTAPAQGGTPGQPVTINWSRTNLPAEDPNWILLTCRMSLQPNAGDYGYASSFGVLNGSIQSNPLVAGANTFYGYCQHRYGAGPVQTTSCQVTTNSAPSNPGSVTGSCPAPGNAINVSWSAISGASYYSLRVDNLANGWNGSCSSPNPGDYCSNVSGTSANITGIPGNSYNAWVSSCNAYGCNSGSTAGVFSCAAPVILNLGFPPPTQNLTINNPANATLTWNSSGVQASSCAVERNFGTSGSPSWAVPTPSAPWTLNNGSTTLVSWAAGSYQFRLGCTPASGGAKTYSSISTLTVNPAPSYYINAGITPARLASHNITSGQSTTLEWVASGLDSTVDCSVYRNSNSAGWTFMGTTDGAPASNSWPLTSTYYAVGTNQYRVDCVTTLGNPISSNLPVLNVGGACGDGICSGSESCNTCSSDCGTCVNNDSVCQNISVNPSRIVVGGSFVGTINMQNTGTSDWTPPDYYLTNVSGINWGVSESELSGAVAGEPVYAVANFIVNATAPSTPGNYPFQWQMEEKNPFGDICSIPGGINVVKPQCDDGVDNDGDTKNDCSDPQCLNSNNTCNRLCDDELNGCGSRLILTANPPLVRNGGRSSISWDISQGGGNCTLTGPNGFQRTGLGDGKGSEIISPINQRQTFYLTCGGLTTRATVSVIKFIEPRPVDTRTDANTAFARPVFNSFNRSSFYGGGYYDLTWNVSNAEYCVASRAWTGVKSTSGYEQSYIPADSTKTHTLTCYNFSGSASADLVVGRSDEDPGGLGSY